MKKILITLISLLLVNITFGQVTEYDKDFNKFKKEVKKIERQYDFILDPIAMYPLEVSNDISILNWALDVLKVNENFDLIRSKSVRGIDVYIIDTAGKLNHKNLKLVSVEGKSFTGEQSLDDGNGHGTHCAGIIADAVSSGITKGLIAKQNIVLHPYKALRNDGGGYNTWVASAIEEAVKDFLTKKNRFGIISMSLGSSSSSSVIQAALKKAVNAGMIVVAAAGNTGTVGVNYPGKYPETVCVASVSNTNGKIEWSYFSNRGPEVMFGLPGHNIRSTYLNDQYANLSGTSMATPQLAGLFAIMASIHPNATASQLIEFFKKKVQDLETIGFDDKTGYGMPTMDLLLVGSPNTETPAPPPVEPPAPPVDTTPVVKPTRTMEFEIQSPMSVVWGWMGQPDSKVVDVYITVKYTHSMKAELAATLVSQLSKEFSKNRGFILKPDSDIQEFMYWYSYFYEMLVPRYYGQNLEIASIYTIVDGVKIEYNDPIAKRDLKLKNQIKAFAEAITYVN